MGRLFEQLQKAAEARERQRAPVAAPVAAPEPPAANDGETAPAPPPVAGKEETAPDPPPRKRRDFAPHVKALALMVAVGVLAVAWYYAAYAPSTSDRAHKPATFKIDPNLDLKRSK